MEESISTFAQHNAAIINDFGGLRDDAREHGEPERTFLLWNDDNSTVFYNRDVTHLQQMDVSPIIAKLNEVITVMNSFDIQVKFGNIYNAIAYVAHQINFLEDEKTGYFMTMKLLASVNAKLTNTNQGIKSLSAKYAEVAKRVRVG